LQPVLGCAPFIWLHNLRPGFLVGAFYVPS
jgi:hypothetical protein